MGKDQQKKQNNAPSHLKKGRVIDRRRNHTIDQSRKASHPTHVMVDGLLVQTHGVLRLEGPLLSGPRSNPIYLAGRSGFVSYKKPPVKQEEAVYVKVTGGESEAMEVPTPAPTGQLPVSE